jgi:1,4-dihydroxy-2-naphthoate octaprenyltransferase
MNVSMWVKALRVIPRLEKDEWDRLDVISRWLVSTRAAVLIMTFFSAAIAGLLALRAGQFNLGRWLLLAIGLIFAHAANNMINDLTDYKRGVDKNNYFRTLYGPQPLEQGLMNLRQALFYIAITGLIAIAAGIPLVIFGGTTALILMLLGAFFVLFYTFPLKYIGLGEVAVLIIWGPLMVAGGYYVITGHWDWNVVIASLPYAFGPTTVLFGKHIDKLPQDKAKGIHTLPVILGEKTARYAALVMMGLQYLTLVYLVIIGYFTPVMLITLLGLYNMRLVLPMFLKPKPAERPAEYSADTWPLWFSASAFYQNRGYGALFLLGLVLELAIKLIWKV